MIEQLTLKLSQQIPYSNSELNWLLEHIGHPDPTIRDELVYASFCHALLQQLVSTHQLQYLFENTRHRNLLFYQIGSVDDSTLTRSFTALLYHLMVYVDSQAETDEASFLSPDNRNWLFDSACHYLQQEKDWRGYDPDKGWVHAIAHGADMLTAIVAHPMFPNNHTRTIWQTIVHCIKQGKQMFTAGEERRLAQIISQGIIAHTIQQEQLVSYIQQTHFPDDSPEDYLSSLNYDHFLAALYFQLLQEPLETESLLKPIAKRLSKAN